MAYDSDRHPMFPIYWVSQRVGRSGLLSDLLNRFKFPIYWVSQRVGSAGIHSRRYRPTPPVSNLLGFPASGESTLLKPAWIGNGKGHLRASPKIVIHCTVSDPEKSPQTPSGSYIEHLHEKMGISRFWLDPRIITEPSSSDRNRVTLLDVGRCPRSVTGGGYAGVESLIKVVENRIVK